MKELRAKVTLDESGFLASIGRVESAVSKLGRAGLASGFVESFKRLGDRGMFTGMLDGLENAVRGVGKLKAARSALAAAHAASTDAEARKTTASAALDKAIAAVNAGRHPVTGQFTGPLSARKMAGLTSPFAAEFKAASDAAAKSGDAIKSAMGAGSKAALDAVVGVAGAIFGVVRFLGSLLAGIVKVVWSMVSAALDAIKSLVGSIVRIVGTVGTAVAAVAVTTAGILMAGVKKAVDLGAQVVNLRARTGLGAKDQLVFGRAFELAGLDPQVMAMTANRMQGALSGINEEGKDTRNSIAALGLDIGQLRKMTTTEQLEAFGMAIANLKNPADRAAAVMDIFTKRGFGALQFFNQMATVLKTAREQFGAAADVMEHNKDKFAFISRAWDGLLHIKPQAVFIGVASGMSNALTFFADKINTMDFTKLGERIGAALNTGITILYNAFQEGKLWDLAKLGMVAAFTTAGDKLIDVIFLAGAFFKNLLGDTKFISSLGDAIGGAFKVGIAIFLEAFKGVLPDIAEGLGRVFGTISNLLDPKAYALNKRDALLVTTYARDYENKVNVPGQEANAAEALKLMNEAQARIDAREQSGAVEGGASARRTAEQWTTPENIGRLRDTGLADIQKLGAVITDVSAAWKSAFEKLKPSDFLNHTQAWKDFMNLAASLMKSLPKVDVGGSGGAGMGEPDPFEKIFKRSHEAPSALEKVGASFNRPGFPSRDNLGAMMNQVASNTYRTAQ